MTCSYKPLQRAGLIPRGVSIGPSRQGCTMNREHMVRQDCLAALSKCVQRDSKLGFDSGLMPPALSYSSFTAANLQSLLRRRIETRFLVASLPEVVYPRSLLPSITPANILFSTPLLVLIQLSFSASHLSYQSRY